MVNYSDFLLVAVFLLYLITGIKSRKDKLDVSSENFTCIVPPVDAVKNGGIENDQFDEDKQPPPGTKMFSFVLTITCDPGYKLIGQRWVQCITDRFSDPLPKCVAPCQTKSPELLSCGVGYNDEESQCLITNSSQALTAKSTTNLQCGVSSQIFRNTVANGTLAKLGDAPWHAGVYKKTTKPYMQICGGTIISTNVILSAAHCFWGDIEKKLPAENYAVAVGKIYRPWDNSNDGDAQKSDIKEIRIPPRFQGSATNFQDDIAALMLVTPIMFTLEIVPVCLDFDYQFDKEQLTHGNNGRVVGWGLTSADGVASQVLNKAELPVVDIEQCIAQSQPEFLESITSDKICAGYNNGTSVCRGDSGGGLAFEQYVGDAFRYFLRGVVSTAPTTDHLCNVYAVATFTHIIKHEHFIKAALEGNPTETFKVTPPNITTEEAIEQANLNNAKRYGTDIMTTTEVIEGGPLTPNTDSGSNVSIVDIDHESDYVYTAPEVFHSLTEYLEKTNSMPCFYTRFNMTACKELNTTKGNKLSNNNTTIDTNFRLQVVTESTDSAPITNPPVTIRKDGLIPNTERTITNKNGNIQDGPDQDKNPVPNPKGVNQGLFNQESQKKVEPNKEGVNKGETYQRFPISGGFNTAVINPLVLNQRLQNQGGLNETVPNKRVNNQGVLNQEIIYPLGINQASSNQKVANIGAPGPGSVNQEVTYQGSINQNQAVPNQIMLNQGGITQGVPNQGHLNEGFLPQNYFNQGFPSAGEFNKAVPYQGIINHGVLLNQQIFLTNTPTANRQTPNQNWMNYNHQQKSWHQNIKYQQQS